MKISLWKFFSFLLFVCFAMNASAEGWKQIGPSGQSILQIVPDRKTGWLWFLTVAGNEPKSAFLSRGYCTTGTPGQVTECGTRRLYCENHSSDECRIASCPNDTQ